MKHRVGENTLDPSFPLFILIKLPSCWFSSLIFRTCHCFRSLKRGFCIRVLAMAVWVSLPFRCHRHRHGFPSLLTSFPPSPLRRWILFLLACASLLSRRRFSASTANLREVYWRYSSCFSTFHTLQLPHDDYFEFYFLSFCNFWTCYFASILLEAREKIELPFSFRLRQSFGVVSSSWMDAGVIVSRDK